MSVVFHSLRWPLNISLLLSAWFLIACSPPSADEQQPLASSGNFGNAQPASNDFKTKKVIESNSPAAANSSLPHLAKTVDGRTVLSWVKSDAQGHSLRYSVFDGAAWSAAATVASGENWFVNWADFPSVQPISKNLWAAHWLVKSSAATYAYDVAISISNDGGLSWSPAITPHSDNTETEHGFVSLFPWQGNAGAIWLDGRNTKSEQQIQEHSGSHDDMHDAQGSMSLYAAQITKDGEVLFEQELDTRVCDCCQTDVAVAHGKPLATFRDRSEHEIRDIALLQLNTQAPPDSIEFPLDQWKISGCPVNGPAIDVLGSTIAVAWFTAADNTPKIKLAISNDNGKTFNASDIDSDQVIGRVDVLMLDARRILLSYMRTASDDNAELVVREASVSGTVGPAKVITAMDAARASGFPQMMQHQQQIIFAWTDTQDGKPRVKIEHLALH